MLQMLVIICAGICVVGATWWFVEWLVTQIDDTVTRRPK